MIGLIKDFWRLSNREEKLFAARGVASFLAMASGEICHAVYMRPDPWWIIFGWAVIPALWLLGEYLRAEHPKGGDEHFLVASALGVAGLSLSVVAWSMAGVGFTVIGAGVFLCALGHWPTFLDPPAPVVVAVPPPPTTFGSAQWGTLDYMIQHGLIGGDGLLLGLMPGDGEPHRLRYAGDSHLLTFAPTGSGKGTTAIIPNLLTHRASCLVVDPKGENALITANARRAMGQTVHIVDPWGEAADAGPAARFNPLDWLVPGDPCIAENAMILADALVVPDPKGSSFWDEEAKALLQGLILHVATDELEAHNRHLGRVRELLVLEGEVMFEFFEHMTHSVHRVVASAGARSLQKDPKTLANVLSSAQSHTTFLEAPQLCESLSASDFRFEDLKTKPTTIYLVLPSDRLSTYGRWLRLLIQQAITVNARNAAHRPDKPILFLLDEMAALGKLSMVKQAYGLMRGYGMRLWGIVQDAGQLKELYGDAWEGFVANSGVIMYHGSPDNFTTDYFSKMCGVATVLNFSSSTSHSSGTSHSTSYGPQTTSSSGTSYSTGATLNMSHTQRQLAFPDELARLGEDMQLVLIGRHRPMLAGRLAWFKDGDLKQLGRNLRVNALDAPPCPMPTSPRAATPIRRLQPARAS